MCVKQFDQLTRRGWLIHETGISEQVPACDRQGMNQ